MEYQNWRNFKELKKWILNNFNHEYVTKNIYNQLIKNAGTMFTNHSIKCIYGKKVENGSWERKR